MKPLMIRNIQILLVCHVGVFGRSYFRIKWKSNKRLECRSMTLTLYPSSLSGDLSCLIYSFAYNFGLFWHETQFFGPTSCGIYFISTTRYPFHINLRVRFYVRPLKCLQRGGNTFGGKPERPLKSHGKPEQPEEFSGKPENVSVPETGKCHF